VPEFLICFLIQFDPLSVIGFFVKDTKVGFSPINKVAPKFYLFGKIGINLLERFRSW